MALAMVSMAGLRGSSQAVLEGSRQSNRLIRSGNTGRTAVARTGFSVRASSAETETSRRAMLGVVAAGIVSGSFVQAVLAEAATPPPPFGALAAASLGTKVGGWTPIENPQAPEVVEIAKFAVEEHNKEKKTSLVLDSVVKGQTQVVAGINYRLLILAKNGPSGRPEPYSTLVYSGLAPKSLELIDFVKLLLED